MATVTRATTADSATARMLAARQSSARRAHGEKLWAACLTRYWPAHIVKVDRWTEQEPDWQLAVCLHSPAGLVSWRITQDDATTLYAGLERWQCDHDGHTYDVKMLRGYDFLATTEPIRFTKP